MEITLKNVSGAINELESKSGSQYSVVYLNVPNSPIGKARCVVFGPFNPPTLPLGSYDWTFELTNDKGNLAVAFVSVEKSQ